jgi:hypothetical protein
MKSVKDRARPTVDVVGMARASTWDLICPVRSKQAYGGKGPRNVFCDVSGIETLVGLPEPPPFGILSRSQLTKSSREPVMCRPICSVRTGHTWWCREDAERKRGSGKEEGMVVGNVSFPKETKSNELKVAPNFTILGNMLFDKLEDGN